jgi:hypothetical protein
MRVALFLTVAIPAFAAQLVAYALPRVEVAPFTLLRRVAETTERKDLEVKIVHPARPLPPVFAFTQHQDEGFVAAAAPEGSAARALIFVKHARYQAS